MDYLEKRPVQNPDTAWRSVDEECIIITPRQSLATVLNSVGTRVWELSDGQRRVAEIIDRILEEYDTDRDTVTQDVHSFIDDLIQRGLMTLQGEE